MSLFDKIRSLDSKLDKAFKELEKINPKEVDKNTAFVNLVKGFKQMYVNIKNDLVNPYYKTKDTNVETTIVERLEGLLKLMSIIIEFENE